jgi:hypothetical protein
MPIYFHPVSILFFSNLCQKSFSLAGREEREESEGREEEKGKR